MKSGSWGWLIFAYLICEFLRTSSFPPEAIQNNRAKHQLHFWTTSARQQEICSNSASTAVRLSLVYGSKILSLRRLPKFFFTMGASADASGYPLASEGLLTASFTRSLTAFVPWGSLSQGVLIPFLWLKNNSLLSVCKAIKILSSVIQLNDMIPVWEPGNRCDSYLGFNISFINWSVPVNP